MVAPTPTLPAQPCTIVFRRTAPPIHRDTFGRACGLFRPRFAHAAHAASTVDATFRAPRPRRVNARAPASTSARPRGSRPPRPRQSRRPPSRRTRRVDDRPSRSGPAWSRRRIGTVQNEAATPSGVTVPSPSMAIHWPANSSITTQPGSPSIRAACTAQTPPTVASAAAAARAIGDHHSSAAPTAAAAAEAIVPEASGAKPMPKPAASQRANPVPKPAAIPRGRLTGRGPGNRAAPRPRAARPASARGRSPAR